MVQTQTIPHTSASMLRLGLPIAAAWFLIDQVSKWWIINSVMQPPRVIPVTEFFNLVLWHNTGVSFGLFGDTSPWMLMIFTLAMVIGLIVWLMRAANRLTAIALGLIIGGALANILDRLRHGAVTDFLDFYVAAYHWPAFNLADVGIVSGVSLLLLESVWPRGEGRVRKADPNSIR
ncbi:signal peptidase II [Aurantimonas coralicida]|uniref:signal peptidase II n=1 Tax=Aurantimonas coralicida TaxID=182270 RepID=UPI001D186DE6|nr:signal peptidase II [Aurantimonas coralicida]MCC4300233.1 signal peptidase II [Aurantimonas coralicida]